MLAFIYPNWSLLPMLYMLMASWVVLVLAFAVISELATRLRAFATRHALGLSTRGHPHQPRGA